MATTVTWNGTSRSIPAAGEYNWAALSDFLVDLGQHAATAITMVQSSRVATSTPVTISATTDGVVITKLSVAGAVAVSLPAGVAGQLFYVIDGTGDASTNNITITPNGIETINGGATYVINKNYGGVILSYNATTKWSVVNNVPKAILNADVDAAAAIAYAKLAPLSSGNILVGSAGNVATSVAMSGDAMIAASGALTISGLAVNKLAALTVSRAVVTDGSGFVSAASATATQIGYLASATGTTGTASTNLVYSTSPTLVTPTLGVASATSINFGGSALAAYVAPTDFTPAGTDPNITGAVNVMTKYSIVGNMMTLFLEITTISLTNAAQSFYYIIPVSKTANMPGGSDLRWFCAISNAGATQTMGYAGIQSANPTRINFYRTIAASPNWDNSGVGNHYINCVITFPIV